MIYPLEVEMSEIAIGAIVVLLAFCAIAWAYIRIFRGLGSIIFYTSALALLGLAVFFRMIGLIIILGILGLLIFFELRLKGHSPPYPGIEIVYEGGGIRRGLDAVEVSVLFQNPDHKRLIISLVGLLEKNLVMINNELKITVSDWIKPKEIGLNPSQRAEYRLSEAFSRNIVLLPGEDVLLEVLEHNKDRMFREINIDLWIAFLDKNFPEKIAGYDLISTQKYYTDFVLHRINNIWRTPEKRIENIQWLVFVFLNENLFTELPTIDLGDLSPAWLPGTQSLEEFVNALINK